MNGCGGPHVNKGLTSNTVRRNRRRRWHRPWEFLTTKGEKKKTRPRSVAFVCVFCVCKKTHYHRKHRPKPHRKTSGGTAWGALVATVKQSFTANRALEPPEPIAAVLSNPFGGFAFEPVLPCSAYTVTARHRFFSFGKPIHIELISVFQNEHIEQLCPETTVANISHTQTIRWSCILHPAIRIQRRLGLKFPAFVLLRRIQSKRTYRSDKRCFS